MVFSCLLSGSFSFKSQQVQVAPHASLRMFDLDEQNLAQSFRLLLQNPSHSYSKGVIGPKCNVINGGWTEPICKNKNNVRCASQVKNQISPGRATINPLKAFET